MKMNQDNSSTGVLEDGIGLSVSNDFNRTHFHPNRKAVLNRLARAIGHLEKVRLMVEKGEDCSDVLIQLSAVRSALNNTGKLILKDHLEHCLVHAVETGNMEMVSELNHAIDQFIKS